MHEIILTVVMVHIFSLHTVCHLALRLLTIHHHDILYDISTQAFEV